MTPIADSWLLFSITNPNSISDLFDIVHEDRALLAVNKPAGLVCHPTKSDERSSLVGRVRLYAEGAWQPRLVNRLDRETSGIVVVAKDKESAGELGKIWETRAVLKEYLAIVQGWPTNNHEIIEAPIGKDEVSRVAIKDCAREDGLPARTEFWVERRFVRATQGGTAPSRFSLLRVQPHSGRKHQIRIHLTHRGHPIVGDKIYGGDEDLYLALVEDRLTEEQRVRLILPFQALHAHRVELQFRGERLAFRAKPEAWFEEFVQGRMKSERGNLIS